MIQKAPKNKQLTGKQRLAVEHYVQHGDKSAAYRACYACGRMKPTTINRNAHRLFEAPGVRAYVEELQTKAQTKAVVKRSEALELLSRFARAGDLDARERMAALQQLAKLQGWEAAQKLDINPRVTFEINITGDTD
jgi:phage terminase small subunit